MVAGGRADLFLHPAPILRVLVNWLNLEDALVQLDDVAGEMPFYLLLNIRDRPDVLSASQQLGAALLRLQNDGQWQKMLTKSEQRAIARCLKGGQTSC
jgi:ABC-type amino acid transport substrate-binding protein